MNTEPSQSGRWHFIRDVLVLQGKLVIDGFRDAALIPVSLVAAVADVLSGGPEKRHFFYDVVHMGRRSEQWINLFGAADRVPARRENLAVDDEIKLDHLIDRVERRLVEQQRAGGLSAKTKSAVDHLFNVAGRSARFTKRDSDQS
ncbi:MAG: hypothetical protein V3U59_09405 [Gammaproteobacteria bacterium]